MALSIPIVLCGKSTAIAVVVIEHLKPEFEAIHVLTSTDAAVNDIPSLIEGIPPPSKDPQNLGSQHYGRKPVAVVTGGGYSDAEFEEIQEACKGKSTVPWLRPDLSKSRPPLGSDAGKAIAERVKDFLKKLFENGKMGSDGVYYY